VGVLAQVVTKLLHGLHPNADTMGVVGSLALAANTVCLVMLWRRRRDDVNMRSAWMCSLNDVAGNAGVIVAGAAVALTGSGWPDILVGLMIAGMFCASATHIIRAATARPA
jgi:Co/Zn/Cd efflux system component